MELFEPVSEFLKDKSEMMLVLLMTTDGKASVCYLALRIFFRKFVLQTSSSNKLMQYCDAKENIFGFVTFLSLFRNNILSLYPIFLVKIM